MAHQHRFISTGLSEVDQVLGGGFLRGHVAEVMGDEGAGKTSLVLRAAANAGVALWFDLDGTFPFHVAAEIDWAQNVCPIIDPDRIPILTKLICDLPGIMHRCDLIVFDPVAVLGARGIVDLTAALQPLCKRFDCAAVLVNHCDTLNRSTGHSAISFYAGQRLEVRFERALENGMLTAIRCVKNVAAPPFNRCSRTISFGEEEQGGAAETKQGTEARVPVDGLLHPGG